MMLETEKLLECSCDKFYAIQTLALVKSQI